MVLAEWTRREAPIAGFRWTLNCARRSLTAQNDIRRSANGVAPAPREQEYTAARKGEPNTADGCFCRPGD
jgi:hypothetical protein